MSIQSGQAIWVLVVDDHPLNRELLATQLELLGLKVDTAEDGVDALAKWQGGRYGLVMTDCHMPRMDGYALAQEIRRLEAEEGRVATLVVACTANTQETELARCRAVGMAEVLTKPASMDALRAVVQILHNKNVSLAEKPIPSTRSPTAASTTTKLPTIDFSVLQESMVEPAAQWRVLNDFQCHIRTEHLSLDTAVAVGDLARVVQITHRMKGASLMVGARVLAEVCANLERVVQGDDKTGIPACLADIDNALIELVRVLDNQNPTDEIDSNGG